MSVLDRFSLKGRTAIVTGSGQGIGKAIATAFAEAGANLVLAGMNVYKPEDSESQLREVAGQLQKLGSKATYVVTDMRVQKDVEAMLDKALEEFGKVDILVNVVGGASVRGPITETSLKAFEEGLWENLMTKVLGCQIVGRHMKSRRSGAIVNIGSTNGRVASAGGSARGAANAGVMNLTQSLAWEFGPYGIRVNCINPWFTMSEWAEAALKENPEMQRQAATLSPLGRGGRPDELAALALFLCSDASSFVSGQIIDHSGGALPGTSVSASRDPVPARG